MTKVVFLISTMFEGRFKLYTIIRLMVQAAPKVPDGVIYGKMYGELNTTATMVIDEGVKVNRTRRVLTFCLMYNMESEVKNSYWGLFGSYPLGLSLLAPQNASSLI